MASREDLPSAPDNDERGAFFIGQALGRIESKVDAALSAQTRIEAQQTQILEQHELFAEELKKLASELVDVRARVTKLESAPPPPLPPIRAPLPSVNTEVKTELRSQHDSIRAVAQRQELLDQKQDEQTALLRALSKSPKVQAALFLLGGLLYGTLCAWQASRPPTVVMAPASPALPRALP